MHIVLSLHSDFLFFFSEFRCLLKIFTRAHCIDSILYFHWKRAFHCLPSLNLERVQDYEWSINFLRTRTFEFLLISSVSVCIIFSLVYLDRNPRFLTRFVYRNRVSNRQSLALYGHHLMKMSKIYYHICLT